MNKKKICVYIPSASFFVGGGEIVPLMQARYLQKYYQVTLITIKSPEFTDYFSNFIKENSQIIYKFIKLDDFILKILNETFDHTATHKLYFYINREVNKFLIDEAFDIVITHYVPGIYAVPIGTKSILYLHGVPSENQVQNYIGILTADKLIAVSESVKNGWEKLIDKKITIKVIHNGIETKIFKPNKKIKEDIDLLYIGRLIEIKGIQYLIEAVNILKLKNKKNLKVIIGGRGPFELELKKLIQNYKLENDIKLIGYIPEASLLNYYQRAKICIFPSYQKEGVLTTLLESASTAKSIITSKCCGMLDFIKDGKNGLFFEPENSKDLAKKIEYLMLNNEYRTQLGKEARKNILKNWTWNNSINKLVKEIEN